MQVSFDWFGIYTPKEAEISLSRFKFLGPGLYTDHQETILVVPNIPVDAKDLADPSFWEPKCETYAFYVYNCPVDMTIFKFVSGIPVRS